MTTSVKLRTVLNEIACSIKQCFTVGFSQSLNEYECILYVICSAGGTDGH